MHPAAPARVIWDIVQGFIVLFLFIDLPIELAFGESGAAFKDSSWTLGEVGYLGGRYSDGGTLVLGTPTLATFIDVMMILDFFLQFRMAYRHDVNGDVEELVTDQRAIFIRTVFGDAHNFIPSTYFVVSLVSAIPLDAWLDEPYFRLLKCSRVERLKHVIDDESE